MKEAIKRIARSFDLEIRRFAPASSETARLRALFAYHAVNLVFDVGANTGQYGLGLRAQGYRGRIVSFEPLAAVHRELSIHAQRDTDWLVPLPMALGERDDEVEINVAGNSVSSSLLNMLDAHQQVAPQSAYVGKERVRLARLDSVARDYMREGDRVFLKIDTQGCEIQVIRGAEAILDKLCGLQVELSLVPLYDGQLLFSDMVRELAQREFVLHGLIPGLTDPNSGRLLQADGVFFRDPSARPWCGSGHEP